MKTSDVTQPMDFAHVPKRPCIEDLKDIMAKMFHRFRVFL